MNVLNRIVMVLLILALMALAAVMFYDPQRALEAGTWGMDMARDGVLSIASAQTLYYRIALAVLGLLLFVLLILELRRTRKKSVRIRTEGSGKASIGVESVTQSLAYRIDELPGVRDAKPRISSRGKDVTVSVELHTSPSVNVPNVTNQVVALAHEIIETQLGVKIHGPVEVVVAHEPFPRGSMSPAPNTRPVARPQSSSGPMIPPAARPPVSGPVSGPRTIGERPSSSEAPRRPDGQ
ncbi:MAG: alkaline shock response membrane anchor protein AmaP [Anaerolineae bacterium]|jgi:hypothetical protein|nr:alkaline shock response membrane anchor protein AmaP [Chloroflexota bacterium]